MDRKRSVLAGFMALFLLGAGSASVLSSFGSISGTVDVKPALRVTEIQANAPSESGGEKIEIYNPSTAPVDLTKFEVSDGDNNTLKELNGTDVPAQDYAVVVPKGYSGPYKDSTHYFEADSPLSVDNSDGKIKIWLSDLEIDQISYSSSCTDAKTLQRDSIDSKSFRCDSETFGSGGY